MRAVTAIILLGMLASRTVHAAAPVRNEAELGTYNRTDMSVYSIVRHLMARTPVIRIELGNVTSAQQLHTLLMESLNFPGWYGRNWNAFWDAITALVEMPERLVLNGWQQFSLRMPGEAHLMRKCLEDMSKQYPRLSSTVVYA